MDRATITAARWRPWLLPGLLALATLAPARSRAQRSSPTSTAEVSDAPEGSFRTWAERFKGSTFLVDQSLTLDAVAPGVQQSATPSYAWWFSLRPRYYFRKDLSLRVRADLTVDALNGTETTYAHEAVFGDLWTDLVWTGIPKFGGVNTSLGLRALWPTSKVAQARGSIVGLGPTLGFNRPVRTRGGTIDFTLSGTATFPINSSEGPSTKVSYPCHTSDFRSGDCDSLGAVNTLASLTAIVGVSYAPISRLSIGLNYILIEQLLYKLPTTTLVSPGGVAVELPPSADDSRQRQYGWFLATVDVKATEWLEVGAGYYVYRPILDPDSRTAVGNPFWAPGGASRIFLSLTFGIDAMFSAIASRGDAAGTPVATIAPAPRATF